MADRFYVGAGHSSADPGAVVGADREAVLMTELRNLVVERMREKGAAVVTDGEGEVNRPLAEAIALARDCDRARIELHLNAATPAARGVECLSLETERPLASALARAIADTLEIPLRGEAGWKPDTAGQHSRLAFCRQAHGIVVECFFLTNPDERAKYAAKKAELAAAIADALVGQGE